MHEHTRPHLGCWEADKEPPVIEADSAVGHGTQVVGGVRIGPRSMAEPAVYEQIDALLRVALDL